MQGTPPWTRDRRAAIALLLLVPVPTIGVWFGMWLGATAGTPVGDLIYGAAKVWLLLLPIGWRLLVERRQLSWSPPHRGGFGMGVATGLAMSAAIILGYVMLGDRLIDPELVEETAAQVGIDRIGRFLLLALYICTVNAVLEEYAWRWFCFRQCEKLVRIGWIAVMLSAAFFTLHHVLALFAVAGPAVAAIGSIGVYIGGCVWSWLYARYRSIWPGFASHVIVDVAIFAIAWRIIFA